MSWKDTPVCGYHAPRDGQELRRHTALLHSTSPICTVHIHNQQAQATLPCTCPWHSAHPYSADTHSFARHTPSVDVAHTLRRRSMNLPHDERPACKTHANSISTGRPMQLRTNRRPHAPAPSSMSPVKLRTNRRPDAPSPSSVSPVKLRAFRHGRLGTPCICVPHVLARIPVISAQRFGV